MMPIDKLAAELINTNSTPTAHVSKGLSQKAALRALEGLQKVNHCHVKATIPAHAVAVRSGGYHFLG